MSEEVTLLWAIYTANNAIRVEAAATPSVLLPSVFYHAVNSGWVIS
jgi:hypothetical protein